MPDLSTFKSARRAQHDQKRSQSGTLSLGRSGQNRAIFADFTICATARPDARVKVRRADFVQKLVLGHGEDGGRVGEGELCRRCLHVGKPVSNHASIPGLESGAGWGSLAHDLVVGYVDRCQ